MRPVEARGVIPPDSANVARANSLRGPISKPSRILRGAGAVLGFGTSALTLAACARPETAQVEFASAENTDFQAAVNAAVEATKTAQRPAGARNESTVVSQKESPLTLEQQAEEATLVVWLNLFSGEQKANGRPTNSLLTSQPLSETSLTINASNLDH